MEPQNAREALEVVVDERVVQLLRGLLAGRGHDAVPREERELAAGGGVQGRRVDPQPAQIAQDEAQRREGGTGEAQERVLRVCLESDAVVKQGRDNRRDKEACIPAAPRLLSEENLPKVSGKLTDSSKNLSRFSGASKHMTCSTTGTPAGKSE